MSSRAMKVCSKRSWRLWLAVGVVAAFPATVGAASGMVAATPPMGWNSWHAFRCDIDEQLVRATADAMVENGMKDAGYEYVVIDDCWQASRDARGTSWRTPRSFPPASPRSQTTCTGRV